MAFFTAFLVFVSVGFYARVRIACFAFLCVCDVSTCREAAVWAVFLRRQIRVVA